jgi:hypothetical protein
MFSAHQFPESRYNLSGHGGGDRITQIIRVGLNGPCDPDLCELFSKIEKEGFDPLPTYREPDQSPLGDPQMVRNTCFGGFSDASDRRAFQTDGFEESMCPGARRRSNPFGRKVAEILGTDFASLEKHRDKTTGAVETSYKRLDVKGRDILIVDDMISTGSTVVNAAGIARRLYNTGYRFIGHVPGGMAMATVAGATAFKAIYGSSPATAATFASVAVPEMDRYGYSRTLSTGIVAASGTLGCLIPPSVPSSSMALLLSSPSGNYFSLLFSRAYSSLYFSC